jgi:hypothetical protein
MLPVDIEHRVAAEHQRAGARGGNGGRLPLREGGDEFGRVQPLIDGLVHPADDHDGFDAGAAQHP